jgi:hypothetical protein
MTYGLWHLYNLRGVVSSMLFQKACANTHGLVFKVPQTLKKHNKWIPHTIPLFWILIAVACISVHHCQLFHKKNHTYQLQLVILRWTVANS